ncbi:hypothetical protein ANCCAN_29097 [Ancylostoma caninum]|uniref:Uncharacterized protein n=1 Tax=Ancylostoma caninum TaxID=29170 RepID=A0A368EZD2_ANCCA|nr:hypothetical protein ANCCAN_29097 [Ancylostoma caninum]
MITSAFRINSTVQDYQAKQELKEAQDNMRVVEHSRLTFQKKLDNLRENRELLMRQQRMLLNSGNSSGVIVGGSGAVSKGAVKDFAHTQQQAAKAVQPPTTLSLAAQAQAQQLHQLQLHKNLIGIRQPTADSKPPTSAHSPWPCASASKDRDGQPWGENKRFNNMLDRVSV